MKVQSVALTILAASACDEHDPKCGMATAPPLVANLSCPWKVTSDDIILNNPIIRQSNPGRDCDYLNNGLLHLETCEKCGNSHNPCNNTFTACAGCCQTGNDIALKEHNCDDVKDYFRWKNVCPLKLMKAGLEEEPDKSAILHPVIKNHTPDTVLAEGILNTSCKVEVEEFKCPKIPAIVEFDCMQCNIGSADLMAKCCNECVRFSTSDTLAKVSMIEPFVVCKGCETKTIKIDWKGTIVHQPWIHAGKYDDYSRRSQEDRLNKWVDKKVCRNLAKDTCPKSGRFLEAVSTTTTTTREALVQKCRRLEKFTSPPVVTTIVGASSVAGTSTTGVADKNVVPSNATHAATTSTTYESSHADAMSVPVLMGAVIVASVVLV